jgi:hypothetical protein
MHSAILTRFDPSSRGFHMIYRANEINHCPGCGRTHWIIGRKTAECAFCSTAVELAETASVASTTVWKRGKKPNVS